MFSKAKTKNWEQNRCPLCCWNDDDNNMIIVWKKEKTQTLATKTKHTHTHTMIIIMFWNFDYSAKWMNDWKRFLKWIWWWQDPLLRMLHVVVKRITTATGWPYSFSHFRMEKNIFHSLFLVDLVFWMKLVFFVSYFSRLSKSKTCETMPPIYHHQHRQQ